MYPKSCPPAPDRYTQVGINIYSDYAKIKTNDYISRLAIITNYKFFISKCIDCHIIYLGSP